MKIFAPLAVSAALALLPIAAHAVDVGQIKPHMEVKGSDGKHVGTVDKIEGDQITLTKDDKAAEGVHHQLPVTAVGSVAKNEVMLKASAENAMSAWTAIGMPAGDKKM